MNLTIETSKKTIGLEPPEPKRAETKAGDDSDDDDIGAGAK